MFNNINEVLNYIENKTNFQLGLYRVQAFLHEINFDYNKVKYVHIGGTNGKGSTSYYLSNILIENNYKVGFFSSPSIEGHNDRIRINNVFISDQSIIDFVNEYYDLIEKTEVTMFEIDVIMALIYFSDNNVDIAVIEVGMGGRYDGTNIITPLISVITNIGLDHQTYLGNNKQEIAQTKAGIIKDNSIFITSEKDLECIKVFKEEIKEYNTKMISISNPVITNTNPITFNYKKYNNLTLKTKALYQVNNASLVLEIIDSLIEDYNYQISIDTIYKVFAQTTWNGRFEEMSNKPLIIIDGAHNNEGVKALCDSLTAFKDYKITILFAALVDKDSDEMIKQLIKVSHKLVLSEFTFYRSKKAVDLNENFDLEITLDYKTFISEQIQNQKDNELFLITGSLYFISEVRKHLIHLLNDEKQ